MALRAQAAPAFFGHGGAAWSAGCGEASEGGSRLTARSVFGFPSASEGCAASVSVSHSCAAFGDDGAEVDSGAAHGETQHAAPSQAAPLALLGDRAPPGFFAQLGPPPGLEMYYGAGGVARQDHMAVDLAALVPYAPASRKRAAEDDWQPVERPARVFRSVYDTAADQHMDPAFDQVRLFCVAAPFSPLIHARKRILTAARHLPPATQLGVTSTIVTHEELVMDTAPDWSYLAHLSARERQMLPASAETAHDTLLPYDAEMHPVRARVVDATDVRGD